MTPNSSKTARTLAAAGLAVCIGAAADAASLTRIDFTATNLTLTGEDFGPFAAADTSAVETITGFILLGAPPVGNGILFGATQTFETYNYAGFEVTVGGDTFADFDDDVFGFGNFTVTDGVGGSANDSISVRTASTFQGDDVLRKFSLDVLSPNTDLLLSTLVPDLTALNALAANFGAVAFTGSRGVSLGTGSTSFPDAAIYRDITFTSLEVVTDVPAPATLPLGALGLIAVRKARPGRRAV